MKYSILIPTHNRSSYLGRALQSLANMRIPADADFEVLVVLSGCSDNSREIATAFAGRLPIRIFEVSEPGVARARNCGLDAFHGDNLIFLDDDVTVCSGFLEAYHDAFSQNREYGCFAGAILARLEGEPAAVVLDVLRNMPTTYSQLWLGPDSRPLDPNAFESPFGANMGVRRAALGGRRFDETLGRKGHGNLEGGEETLLFELMSRAGVKAFWLPQAQVDHWISPARQTMKYVADYWRQTGVMQVRLGYVSAQEAEASKPAGWRRQLNYWQKRFSRPAAVWIPVFREMMLQDGRRAAFEAGESARQTLPAAMPFDVTAPKFLFLDVNQQCNLKCTTCMYWTREEKALPGHITVDQRSAIIEEFSTLNPAGTIVICGGEALMNPERYWPVTKKCRELGLKCFSVMNGTMVTDAATAERLIAEGPSEITISLNSHIARVHDYTRGVAGSFDLAVNAIRLLLAARQRLGASTRIYAMAIICEQNYRDLEDFYCFVLNDLKADKLKLNFLQPMFGPLKDNASNDRDDKFYNRNIIRDDKELTAILELCNARFALHLDPEWIETVKMYHRSVHANGDALLGWQGKGTEKLICNSFERNIMLDMFGVARLCFSTNFPGTKIQNSGDLKNFWYGNDALRRKMAQCHQYCGISHSVRRVNATLKTESRASRPEMAGT